MLKALCADDGKPVLRQTAALYRKIPEISETQNADRGRKA